MICLQAKIVAQDRVIGRFRSSKLREMSVENNAIKNNDWFNNVSIHYCATVNIVSTRVYGR